MDSQSVESPAEGGTISDGVTKPGAARHEESPKDVEDTPCVHASRPVTAKLERGTSVGRYVVLEQIGLGGMGIVYSAYDPDLDRRIALKLVRVGGNGLGATSRASKAAQDQLVLEARTMARLSHPNVVSVYDVGTHGRDVFVAMELVEGTTLLAWLRAQRRSVAAILDAFLQASRGLNAAHQVGIVHRDFKPTNVLVGDDGVARVMDFGLAGTIAHGGDHGPREGALDLPTPFVFAGTPPYMPPEQYESIDVDARADQYSFCVCLFEALYEVRPFTAAPGETLLDTKKRGVPVAVPQRLERRVPRRVRRALTVGLAPRQEDRWPTMVPLMRALEPVHRGRWAAAGAIVGVVSALSAGAVAYANHAEERAALCSGGPVQMQQVWNPEVRDRIRTAFEAVNVSYSAAAWEQVQSHLDSQTVAWADMYRDACEATQIRREQTSEIMHARMVCLDRIRLDMQALVRVFADADGKVVEKAASAVGAIPPAARCGDLSALETPADLPSDSKTRARVTTLQESLATGNALMLAGKHGQGLEDLTAVAKASRDLEYEPLLIDALLALGGGLDAMARFEEAEAALREAATLGIALGRDRAALRAVAFLVSVIGYKQHRLPEGKLLWEQGGALLRRIGGDPALEAQLENAFGLVLTAHESAEKAHPHLQRALDLLIQIHESNHPKLVVGWVDLGFVLSELNRHDEAVTALLRAQEMAERVLGEGHAYTCMTHNNLGYSKTMLGRLAEAEAHYRYVLNTCSASLGAMHTTIGFAASNLATLLTEFERVEEARELSIRASEIFDASLGHDHPLTINGRAGLAEFLEREGRLEDAAALIERSIAELREALPAVDQTAPLRATLAGLRLKLGDPRAAITEARTSLELTRTHGTDPMTEAEAQFVMAQASARLGSIEQAREFANEARQLLAAGVLPSQAARLRELDEWLATLPAR